MNEDDSEQISSLLLQMGYYPTTNQDEADVAMLVTCSVREKPEDKARSKLGELRIIKETLKPSMIIGVCGCMAQKEGDALKKGRPYLDMVIGTANIWQIPEMISEIEKTHKYSSSLSLPRSANDPKIVPPRTTRVERSLKCFVPVMYGCDNFCSYCVVPYVRGRERSRDMDDVVAEVSRLAENGCREVTLLGQNVNSYGATLDKPTDFATLLEAVNDVDGIERIRFTTSHPKDLSDSLINAIAKLPKVCEHIHLAVQSGDTEVLQRMNRKYSREHFLERVEALRSAVPNIAITTDFLVGFCGETEEQFMNTMSLANEIRFDGAFMFAYNIIPNTAAEKMDGHLPKKVKNERLNRLIALQNAITCDINNSQVGNTYEVLVEGVSPKDSNRLTGLTRQNKTVNFSGPANLVGKLVNVKVTEGHMYGFVGELASNSVISVLEGAECGC